MKQPEIPQIWQGLVAFQRFESSTLAGAIIGYGNARGGGGERFERRRDAVPWSFQDVELTDEVIRAKQFERLVAPAISEIGEPEFPELHEDSDRLRIFAAARA